MRTGRPKAPVVLTDAKRATLESLAARARTRPHLARRARTKLVRASIARSRLELQCDRLSG